MGEERKAAYSIQNSMCRGPVAHVRKVTNRHKEASVARTKGTEGNVVQDEAGGGQRPDFVAFALRLMGDP